MAIRLRIVGGILVALCAARSVPKDGDVYLDDNFHHALNLKFRRDHASEDGLPLPYPELAEHELIDREESDNPNREWREQTYGSKDEQ